MTVFYLLTLLSDGIPKLINSNKPFHPPNISISLLAPHIRHLLTLCAFTNFTYLLIQITLHRGLHWAMFNVPLVNDT